MSTNHILELYFYEGCPYCDRVLKVIKENNFKVKLLDIYEDSENLNKLVRVTGRKTVPCMFIDGSPMHESLDIINWLKQNG